MNRGLLLLAAALACGPELGLSERSEPDNWDSHRRRQNLTIVDDGGTRLEREPADVANDLYSSCEVILAADTCKATVEQGSPVEPPLSASTSCATTACWMRFRLCVAHLAMEISTSVLEVEVISNDIGAYTVPPQSQASRTAMSELAMDASREAMLLGTDAVRSLIGRTSAGTCSTIDAGDEIDGVTLGETVGTQLSEAYWLHREATERAVQGNMAVADAAFDRETSQRRAQRLAFHAPVLSRGHAAHLLVGNHDADPMSSGDALPIAGGDPYCGTHTAIPGIERAMDVIREAGLNPSDLMNPALSIDEIVADSGAMDSHSILDHQEDRYETDLPAEEGDADSFYAMMGIDRASFVAARQGLVEQHIAFARSDTALLPPQPLSPHPTTGDTRFSTLERFAATSTPPGRLSPAVVVARAVEAPLLTTASALSTNGAIAGVDYAREGTAQLLDYVHSVVADGLRSSLESGLMNGMALVHAQANRDGLARLEVDTGGSSGVVRVLGRKAPDMELVMGADGASCAIEGHVDGVPCDLSQFLLEGKTDASLAQEYGFETYVEWSITSQFVDAFEVGTVYAIQRRPGAVQPVAGNFDRAMASPFRKHIEFVTAQNVWADALVDEAIAPRPDRCSRPATSCAGIPFDQRIPLENELSEDGDALESSWRTYLALARRAADEADALGDELVREGLTMDLRAESAMEELEALCGTAIDIDGFSVADTDPDEDEDGPPHAGACPCSAPYVCHRGACVMDPLEGILQAAASTDGPEAARLRACLGDDRDDRLISLGTRTLCVWVNDMNENEICGGDSDTECPALAIGDSCAHISAPTDHTTVAVEGIGLFQSSGRSYGGVPFPPQAELELGCAALRRYRNSGDPAELDSVRDTMRIFHPSTSSQIAEGIKFEATPFTTGSLFRGDQLWLTTGNEAGAETNNWPCAGTPPVMCAMNENGLFCEDAVDCTDPAERAGMTVRLAGAALAARTLTGASLEGLRFPLVPEGHSDLGDGTHARAVFADSAFTSDALFMYSEMEVGCTADGVNEEELFYGSSDWNARNWVRQTITGESFWDGLSPGPMSGGRGYFGSVDMGAYQVTERDAQITAHVYLRPLWEGVASSPGVRVRPGLPGLPEVLDSLGTTNRFLPETTRYWVRQSHNRHCRPHAYNENRAFVARGGLTAENIFDGLELLCEFEIQRDGVVVDGDPACDPNRPPSVNTIDDLPALEDYVRCVADRAQQRGERVVFADVPQIVVDVLRNEGGTGAVPVLGGEYAEQVTLLRLGMIEAQSLSPLLSAQTRGFAEDIRQLELTLRGLDIRDELAGLRLGSTISDQVTRCAVGIASAQSTNGALGGATTAAASTCANSVVQIMLAVQSRILEADLLDVEGQQALSSFTQILQGRVAAIEALHRRVREAQENIDRGLAGLESIRRRGARAIGRAVFADSDEAGRQYRVNTVMRRRMNTLQARYDRARTYAIRMAYLAKVALEQRLGTELTDLGELSLVDDPSTWAMSICEASTIDYQRIRDSSDLDYGSYEGAYIGEYVRRLEGVVESYRLDHPFSDGTDTALVSLRDDVMGVRAPCEYESINLMVESSAFDIEPDAEAGTGGWEPEGCEPLADDSVVNCVHGLRLEETADSTVPTELGRPRAYAVVFGDATGLGTASVPADDSVRWDATYETRLVQRVLVEPGRRYRLSWYGNATGTPTPNDPATSIEVLDENGALLPGAVHAIAEDGDGDWSRYHRFFDTFASDAAQYVRVAVRPVAPTGGNPPDNQYVLLAGMMMEDVTERVLGVEGVMMGGFAVEDHPPAQYHDTGDAPTSRGYACEDTEGRQFRYEWDRVCVNQCPAGTSSCDSEAAETRCYREAHFTLTPHALEAGEQLAAAGFAVGNFNYRTESIGVNFVGSALRDCSGVELPSTCYASGSIPYSIDHLGPYPVRNHTGAADYEAPLFTGRVVHGRGLAAERYLTNPISSADRALAEPYLHRELRGRPLSGTYRIRLWEEPGIQFDRLEDVQILLNYRYWTRLD